MVICTPVANGFYHIHYNGVTWTRTVSATPTVQEKTGDDDKVASIAFDIDGLSGTVESATLHFGVGAVVAGTGDVPLKIVASLAEVDDDEETYAAIHTSVIPYGDDVTDSVGAKSVALSGQGLIDLKNGINAGEPQFGIGLTFGSDVSAHEEITLSADPTLEIVFGGTSAGNPIHIGQKKNADG